MPTLADREERRYKIPFNSAEILKAECLKIEDMMVSDYIPVGFYSMINMNAVQKQMTDDDIDIIDGRRKVNDITITKDVEPPSMNTISNSHFPLLHKLFSVLLNGEINEVLSGYLHAIVSSLYERKGSNIISFLMETEIYFNKMIDNINNKSISDLILKLFCEETDILPAYEERFKQKRLQVVLKFIHTMEPTNHMLDILNACFIVVQAISSVEHIANELVNYEIISSLYDISLKGNQYSLRASILIIMSLMKKMAAGDLSSIIISRFDELIAQLVNNNFGYHPSSNGNDVAYAGIDKYRIMEFIGMLIQSGNLKILEKIKKCDVITVLLNLFISFYNNSILASKIKQIIVDIVLSNNIQLINDLIIQCNTANTILQICKQLQFIFPSKRASQKPTKIIIYRIVEVFNKSPHAEIKRYLLSLPEWNDIENKYFSDIINAIKMNMRDDEPIAELRIHNKEFIKEKENQIIKAFTEYNTNDEKFTVTEYYQ